MAWVNTGAARYLPGVFIPNDEHPHQCILIKSYNATSLPFHAISSVAHPTPILVVVVVTAVVMYVVVVVVVDMVAVIVMAVGKYGPSCPSKSLHVCHSIGYLTYIDHALCSTAAIMHGCAMYMAVDIITTTFHSPW